MEIEKLRGNEITEFLRMRHKYSGCDFIDLLIHKTLKSVGTSKEEFNNREVKRKKFHKPVKTENQDSLEAEELNKFCDGDSCEAPWLKEGCK